MLTNNYANRLEYRHLRTLKISSKKVETQCFWVITCSLTLNIYDLEHKARPIYSHVKGSTTSCKLPSQTNINMQKCPHLLNETFSVGWWLSWNAFTLNLVKYLKSILLRLSDPERLKALSRERTGFRKVLFQPWCEKNASYCSSSDRL